MNFEQPCVICRRPCDQSAVFGSISLWNTETKLPYAVCKSCTAELEKPENRESTDWPLAAGTILSVKKQCNS